jgi:hypothetical protein
MLLQIFCDEFGNTGGRLLLTDQPVLAYAFVMLEPAAVTDIAERLQLLRQDESVDASELKSLKLLRSPRGRDRFAEVGGYLRNLGARICLSIVEKRYQACSIIVETFLDPELHEGAPPEMRLRPFRQKFVDACYDTLPDERLIGFLASVDDDNPNKIAAIGRGFRETLRFHPDEFVSHAADCIETRADEVWRYGQVRAGFPKNSHLPASQYAAFHPGLECVEACLTSICRTGSLLRDQDAQFGEALDAAFASGRKLGELPEAWAYGAELQLNCIESCASASSAQQLGIQLADLAAGLFGRMSRDICQDKLKSEELYRIAGSWRESLLDMERHYVMVSDAKLSRLAPAIFGKSYIRVA